MAYLNENYNTNQCCKCQHANHIYTIESIIFITNILKSNFEVFSSKFKYESEINRFHYVVFKSRYENEDIQDDDIFLCYFA